MTAKNNHERIAYLDVIRAISIILVVYCHYILIADDSVAGNIMMSIAWVGVPCFMIITGALMHRGDSFVWKKYLLKLLTSYLVLCAWKVIYLLVYAGLGITVSNAWQILHYVFFFGSIDGVNTGVMWYMNAYLLVLLIYPVTHFLFRKAGKTGRHLMLFLLISTFISGILLSSSGWFCRMLSACTGETLPDVSGLITVFPFTNYAYMLFYFIAGAFLFEYRDFIINKKNAVRTISAICFVIGIAGLLIIKYLDNSVWTWAGIYLADGYGHLSTMLASLGFYLFLSLFEYGGFFAFLGRTVGKHTLGIYYLHYIMLAVCSRFIYHRLPGYFFGMNLVKTIIIVIICTVIVFIVGKIPILKKLVK